MDLIEILLTKSKWFESCKTWTFTHRNPKLWFAECTFLFRTGSCLFGV